MSASFSHAHKKPQQKEVASKQLKYIFQGLSLIFTHFKGYFISSAYVVVVVVLVLNQNFLKFIKETWHCV